jgi:hypothetical protein
MNDEDRKRVDGCATFYRTAKYVPRGSGWVRFVLLSQPAMDVPFGLDSLGIGCLGQPALPSLCRTIRLIEQRSVTAVNGLSPFLRRLRLMDAPS